ncbi:hypothetical protein [Roseibium sp. Sym1]|uniref:hypothetical protein n=1 Tax=Roseibium sp. Sym1 TaxID=3016006 RepID=UPI0022B3CC62|nr:hypothetical protein [Roseibium sp. Sym1]
MTKQRPETDVSPSKGRVERLIDAIGAEFQAHLIDLWNTSTVFDIQDGAVEKMISREAPFGVIGIKILMRNPGDVNRLFEHQWNFSIGITGCEFKLLDVDYQNDVWIGDVNSAEFAGHEHIAYKSVEHMIAFHGDDFGIGKVFIEKIGALCPSLLEKPTLFFRLPRRAPPAYRYTAAPQAIRKEVGLSLDDGMVLIEAIIKEHGIAPYTILLSCRSDENFWLVDLPKALVDRYQHGLIDPSLGEHHSNLEVGVSITAEALRNRVRQKPNSAERDNGVFFSMSGSGSASGYWNGLN